MAAALLLAAMGAAITHFQPTILLGYTLRQWGLFGGQLAGLLLLVHTGSLLGTRYLAGLAMGIALTLLGFLFTVLHWQYGRPMLLLGLASIPLTYTIRFYHKAAKTRLAWLKWLWVLAAPVGAAGIM